LIWPLAEMNTAITNWAAAAEATPADHPSHAKELPELGLAYRASPDWTGLDGDLDAAITYGTEAVDTTTADHHDRATYLLNLGLAYKARIERNRAQEDLHAAIRHWRAAAASRTAAPRTRMAAAREWGAAAAATDDAAAAVDGFSTAVRLLPILAWRGLDRALREEHLGDVAGLASDAAAWAIEAGQPEQAVELLEVGRSVLWSQLLQTRTALTQLREQHPHLASRLDELGAALDQREYGPRTFEPITGDAARPSGENPETAAVARRRLAEEWDQLVGRVRSLDGFASFLAPTPFQELRRAGANGPAVLVSVSGHRCDALVVTGHGVEVRPLPDLNKEECLRRANDLLRVLDAGPDRPKELLAAQVDRVQVLRALLRWLWDTISRPVMSHLGYLGTPRAGDTADLPRLWWCPTGPLTLLPLHAAGHHTDPNGETLADVVVPSYTPTLTALLRSRERTLSQETPRLLAVGMPTTPAAGDRRFADLPAVPDELEWVAAHLPDCTLLSSPTRQELTASATIPERIVPTAERVVSGLDNHAWVHLTCHGGQDLTVPAQGAIHLSDGPLTVLRIAAKDLPHADLAYLSACQTAIGGIQVLDESIHLAAAIQLAGYRHVIATQWAIDDTYAPDFADTVYAELTTTGHPDATRAAVAVHHAVAALRAREPFRPDLWAAYLHVGP
jgi:tetratricopeptide (TPR) repeat protein